MQYLILEVELTSHDSNYYLNYLNLFSFHYLQEIL